MRSKKPDYQWSKKELRKLVKIFPKKNRDQLVEMYGIGYEHIEQAYRFQLLSKTMIMSQTEVVEKQGRRKKRYILTVYAAGVAKGAECSLHYLNKDRIDHLL